MIYVACVDHVQVIHRLPMPYIGDELHHSGWNACSSCHGDSSRRRDKLVLPSLGSDRIYFIDVGTKPRSPRHLAIIEPDMLHDVIDVSMPHTTHCLADGNIMISTLGNASGDNKGSQHMSGLLNATPVVFRCESLHSNSVASML